MPSGSSAEDFLFGNLGWVGTSPRLLSAPTTFSRQRGNLAGKQSLAHSHFFYGIVLKRELESYSFLLVIVPWEPGVNRPSLRWVGWSFKESQRFAHPLPHNQLGESSRLGARNAGPDRGLAPAPAGLREEVALFPWPMPRRPTDIRGAAAAAGAAPRNLSCAFIGGALDAAPRTATVQGTARQRFGARRESLEGRQTDRQPPSPSDGPTSAAGWPYLLLHQQGSLHRLTPAKHGPLPMFFHPARNKA